ncbi:3-carboxy-cis,cis-muconate cycloisomerase [Flavilitoribacter nigricans]|uniref:3-carboxy-cis,cis-muconate cycloisomerase n=1 Tax=Flavilitoribacter nigricans (strain ATCC 23147 / DSM 23189 / NBRC 102662 / NCIMB 1420 / SS-2) TaxID=1122177 RepID=A0A2D0N0M3_FLAN2|nr:3-carboxy-cis,cis-muconate cycloisomerase [Flavilitoribacter nigricans]PHN01916.1 3-carboxy-cis,cis-muconate cycloisomerase [Flavilitoribacter nigricans DSM 23189 = NBRC 102662]
MYSQYLSDPEIKALTDDAALVRHMLRVEVALAQVQARLGIIPADSAREISEKLTAFEPDPANLTAGTLKNGIPTIPLLALAKQHLSPEAADHLHWGATSQDIMDTATVLIIRETSAVMDGRLKALITNLRTLAEKHRQTPTVARTRTQQAVPITFGQKVDQWYQPLERHRQRLAELRPRLLIVQLGGAGGDLSALGERGTEVARDLARELDLGYVGTWHSQRDSIVEWGSWLALVAGSLGKMAGDILQLSQTEVGEVQERSAGGGSSTMPHKNNPVLSEAIVALARYAGQLNAGLFPALFHQQERDGAAWILEWLSLPPLMIASGTALRHALTISREIRIDPAAMQRNLDKLNGLIYSERASFILAERVSRRDAKELVERACALVRTEGIHLKEALSRVAPDIRVDWATVLESGNTAGLQ